MPILHKTKRQPLRVLFPRKSVKFLRHEGLGDLDRVTKRSVKHFMNECNLPLFVIERRIKRYGGRRKVDIDLNVTSDLTFRRPPLDPEPFESERIDPITDRILTCH